jgi:hypothetical protein
LFYGGGERITIGELVGAAAEEVGDNVVAEVKLPCAAKVDNTCRRGCQG